MRCQLGRAGRKLILWSGDFGPEGFEEELYKEREQRLVRPSRVLHLDNSSVDRAQELERANQEKFLCPQDRVDSKVLVLIGALGVVNGKYIYNAPVVERESRQLERESAILHQRSKVFTLSHGLQGEQIILYHSLLRFVSNNIIVTSYKTEMWQTLDLSLPLYPNLSNLLFLLYRDW